MPPTLSLSFTFAHSYLIYSCFYESTKDRLKVTVVDPDPRSGSVWVYDSDIRSTIPEAAQRSVAHQYDMLRYALGVFDKHGRKYSYAFRTHGEDRHAMEVRGGYLVNLSFYSLCV